MNPYDTGPNRDADDPGYDVDTCAECGHERPGTYDDHGAFTCYDCLHAEEWARWLDEGRAVEMLQDPDLPF